jgi:hypothetical protein
VQRPIFFDPTGRRRRWTRRAVFAVIALLIITALAFATTVATVPASQPLKLGFERPQPLPLRTQVGRLSRSISNLFGRRSIRAATQSQNLTVGFYSPFGGGAIESLRRQVGQLDWIAPTLMTIDHQGNFIATDNAPMRRVLAGQVRRPLVVDVVQNIAGGTWDGAGTTRALSNPAQRASLIRSIDAALDANNDAGVMIDFETMPRAGIAVLRQFIGELHARLAPKRRLVSVTVPIDDEAWNIRAFAAVADKVVLMAYDEHYMTGTSGPIASNAWFVSHVSDALKGVPANKVIVALGSYAYDWHGGDADPLTVEEAWLSALDSGTRQRRLCLQRRQRCQSRHPQHSPRRVDPRRRDKLEPDAGAGATWHQFGRVVATGVRRSGVLDRVVQLAPGRRQGGKARAEPGPLARNDQRRHRRQWGNPARRCRAPGRQPHADVRSAFGAGAQ